MLPLEAPNRSVKRLMRDVSSSSNYLPPPPNQKALGPHGMSEGVRHTFVKPAKSTLKFLVRVLREACRQTYGRGEHFSTPRCTPRIVFLAIMPPGVPHVASNTYLTVSYLTVYVPKLASAKASERRVLEAEKEEENTWLCAASIDQPNLPSKTSVGRGRTHSRIILYE
jgi:hypothetical protein